MLTRKNAANAPNAQRARVPRQPRERRLERAGGRLRGIATRYPLLAGLRNRSGKSSPLVGRWQPRLTEGAVRSGTSLTVYRRGAPSTTRFAGGPPPRERGGALRRLLLAFGRLEVEHVGEQERELDRLRGVEARVAVGVVAVGEPLVGDRDRAARAFGHVLAGHLDVDAARVRTLGAVHGEEAAHFVKDAIERPRLVAGVGLDHVAVHRIARPHHRMPLALHRADQLGQAILDLVVA